MQGYIQKAPGVNSWKQIFVTEQNGQPRFSDPDDPSFNGYILLRKDIIEDEESIQQRMRTLGIISCFHLEWPEGGHILCYGVLENDLFANMGLLTLFLKFWSLIFSRKDLSQELKS